MARRVGMSYAEWEAFCHRQPPQVIELVIDAASDKRVLEEAVKLGM